MSEHCEYCGKKKCPDCEGRGYFVIWNYELTVATSYNQVCKTCGGSGYLEKNTDNQLWKWDDVPVKITSLALSEDKSTGYICKIDEIDQ